MSKKVKLNPLQILYAEREEVFNNLADHLRISATCILFYKHFDLKFPPTPKEYDYFIDLFPDQENTKDNTKAEINYDDLFKELSSAETIEPIQVNFKSMEAFPELCLRCLFVRDIYRTLTHSRELQLPDKILMKIEPLANRTMCKVHELIGYWTAKMEEKKRNKKNVTVKTLKKKEIKEQVRQMLTKKGLLTEKEIKKDRELILEMQRKTRRGERTILNYIKEILEEMSR